MILLEDNTAARAALTGLAATTGFSALDMDLQADLLATASAVSVVDAVCRSAELIYARSSEVGALLQALGAGLASMAAANCWHGLHIDGRGAAMMNALRRDAGEDPPIGVAWPDPEDDPAPLAEFLAEA